jgi:hypothetical protein
MFHARPFQKALTHTPLFMSPRFHAACCHLSSLDEKRWLGGPDAYGRCGGFRSSKASYSPLVRMLSGSTVVRPDDHAVLMMERFMFMVENRSRRRPLWQCSEVTAKLCHSARVFLQQGNIFRNRASCSDAKRLAETLEEGYLPLTFNLLHVSLDEGRNLRPEGSHLSRDSRLPPSNRC